MSSIVINQTPEKIVHKQDYSNIYDEKHDEFSEYISYEELTNEILKNIEEYCGKNISEIHYEDIMNFIYDGGADVIGLDHELKIYEYLFNLHKENAIKTSDTIIYETSMEMVNEYLYAIRLFDIINNEE